MQMPQWIRVVQQQVEAWSQQRSPSSLSHAAGWPPWHWRWRWSWREENRRKGELNEEYQKRKLRIEALILAVKAESVGDLQDVLGSMILSECVYKKPDTELIRALNNFKSDFGGTLVSLRVVEASLDHVPHRYLLAENGDTLFAAFAGTKHYRDFMTDANILQGVLFHDDKDIDHVDEERKQEGVIGKQAAGLGNDSARLAKVNTKQNGYKPAAHRGFLARARGIPALELYRLAQKRDRRLVLCGHSLGGAVAVLATLAILRVFSTPSVSKAGGKLQIKCVTFSQPPVGNGALRDYVHKRGWQQHFRTFCIPEDLVPRILSPAYFQHFREQAPELGQQAQPTVNGGKEHDSEPDNKTASSDRMALGLGPLPKYFWRFPKLVHLVPTPKPLQWFRGDRREVVSTEGVQENNQDTIGITPLEIEEGRESVGLTPLIPNSDTELGLLDGSKKPCPSAKEEGEENKNGDMSTWMKRVPLLSSYGVPSLPSYVPFGQLYLLERTSVDPLSASEYTQLTSVQSVLQELRERFQSHTMRSYRLRFQNIYNLCMSDTSAAYPALTMEHLPNLPHLQQWLGVLGAGMTEIGKIAEPITIRTATALVPIGWTGSPGDKQAGKPFMVDVHGYGLHLCTLVRVRLNGVWCSTTVETLPPPPYAPHELQQVQPKLQKMRIQIGPPLDQGSYEKLKVEHGANAVESSANEQGDKINQIHKNSTCTDARITVEGLGELTVHCSTDFMTASENVVLKLRRVRLMGLEGAGKTSLYFAILGQGTSTMISNDGGVLPDMDWREGVAGGLTYVDGAGVNLQDLASEAEELRLELTGSVGQGGRKADLVVLVHNLAHKIPRARYDGSTDPAQPALAILLDEIVAAGVPYIVAITNKFAVSADRRNQAALTVMRTYKTPPSLTVVVNSCPYTVHGLAGESLEVLSSAQGNESKVQSLNGVVQGAAQRLLSGSLKLVPRPFGRREVVLPTEGVKSLCSLIHSVISKNEEVALEELAREQLSLRTAEELVQASKKSGRFILSQPSTTAAAVGAAFGAGLGVFVAVLVGAASSLRKP